MSAQRNAPMKPRDLVALLNRAAAVIEDRASETANDQEILVEDLCVEAERIAAANEQVESFDSSLAKAATECNAELNRQFFAKSLECDRMRAIHAAYKSAVELLRQLHDCGRAKLDTEELDTLRAALAQSNP